MNKNKNISKMILLGVSFLFLINSYSQIDSLKGKRYFSIHLSNIFYTQLEIRNQGLNLIEPAFTPSYELGIEYSRFTINKWSYQIGVNFSNIGYSAFYYFYSKANVPPDYNYILNDFETIVYPSVRLTFNISGSKDFNINKNNFLHTQIGFNININTLTETRSGFTFVDDYGNSYPFFRMRLHPNAYPGSMAVPSPSFLAKIGITTLLKNKNHLTVNLVGSLHPTPLYIGAFYFNTVEYESKGIIKFKPSYFGLELNYSFYKGNGNVKKKKKKRKKKIMKKALF